MEALNFLNELRRNDQSSYREFGFDSFEMRGKYISRYGFAIPSPAAIEAIRPYAPILEVGAGCGYWAWELAQAGVAVIPTDPGTGHKWEQKHCTIEQLTGVEAVKQYSEIDTLLTVWPDYDMKWPVKTLKAFKGKTVIYVGEGKHGRTADDSFHDYLEKNFNQVTTVGIPQFTTIHDYMSIWSRK